MSGDLWLPPGSVPFDDDVERVIEESDNPTQARKLAEELRAQGVEFATDSMFGSAIANAQDPGQILLPRAWARMELDDGRSVVCVEVDHKPLERMLLDATLEVEAFAVVEWAEHPLIQAACPALSLRLEHYTTFTPLEWPDCPAPFDWKLECAQGFAVCVPHPDPTENRVLYIASPPMTAVPEGFTFGGTPRKVGRNDRCPCGSGIKFKRCCGS